MKSRNGFKDKVDIVYEISTKSEKDLISSLANEKDIIFFKFNKTRLEHKFDYGKR